ncbi:TRAP transporter substrate-binding protein DctP [Antarctobacter sp.]|uniref:TRAP transporter substrate-binding protein n=1 Tax=Antarctobacter sp. TaxID=1872577 RepID=UPI003A8CB1D7
MKLKLTAASLALVTVAAGAAQAEKLIVAHGFQPSHATVQHGIEPWMACVTEKSGGDIEFDHYPSGQIAGFQQAIHSMNSGLTDVTAVSPPYENSKVPLNNLTILPGMGTLAVDMTAGYRTMLTNGSAIEKEWTDNGVMPLFNGVNPPYQLIIAGEPMKTVEAIKGKKIRAGGATINMTVAATGGVPVELPAGDMYVAMQRGTVDATVLSMTSAPAYKLEEVTKSVSSNGNFGSGHILIGMNMEKYQGLSEANRAAVDECNLSVEAEFAKYLDDRSSEVLKEWADQGIEVYEFSEEESAKLSDMLSSVAEDFVAKLVENGVANARETYEQYQAVLAK